MPATPRNVNQYIIQYITTLWRSGMSLPEIRRELQQLLRNTNRARIRSVSTVVSTRPRTRKPSRTH